METVFTNLEHAAWLRHQAAMKRPYWYGTYYLDCTKELLEKKKAQYPSHYGEGRMARYLADIEKGQICGDCVNGAIKGAVWSELGTRKPIYKSHGCPDVNADGMFERCKAWGMEWGGMESMPDEAGIAVRMAGHVGVYVGNGEVAEWRGFAYGCVITKLAARKWLHWYRLPWTEYVPVSENEREEAAGGLLLGTRLLKKGCRGEDVRTLQRELMNLGYPLEAHGADGEYGSETASAVRMLQRAGRIRQDGIYGEQTHALLMNALSGRESEPNEDAPAPPEKYVRVLGGTINVRRGAGLEYDAVTLARRDMRLEWVATAENGWHAVRSGGICGWVSPKYTEVTECRGS